MPSRFFCDHPIQSDDVTIAGQEARHMTQVMRRKTGDVVILFDGSGQEFHATICQIQRSEVTLEVTHRENVDRELSFDLVMAVAFPKGDRQTWLVQKLTELGVRSLIPLRTERGVAQPRASTIAKLVRQSIEASKQCGRNRLMAIEEPCTLSEMTSRLPDNTQRFLAHPSGSKVSQPSVGNVCFAVGPEGGFTTEETENAVTLGWQLISLGSRILRIETAAVALASSRALTEQP